MGEKKKKRKRGERRWPRASDPNILAERVRKREKKRKERGGRGGGPKSPTLT